MNVTTKYTGSKLTILISETDTRNGVTCDMEIIRADGRKRHRCYGGTQQALDVAYIAAFAAGDTELAVNIDRIRVPF